MSKNEDIVIPFNKEPKKRLKTLKIINDPITEEAAKGTKKVMMT